MHTFKKLIVLDSIMVTVYFLSMHFGSGGIWLVKSGTDEQRMRRVRVRIKPIPVTYSYWKRMILRSRAEWRLARAGMFFGLMSAFNIGYQELNFGQWLSMLTKREYQLKAVGWDGLVPCPDSSHFSACTCWHSGCLSISGIRLLSEEQATISSNQRQLPLLGLEIGLRVQCAGSLV